MGERSKVIGEFGEDAVKQLLTKIGWSGIWNLDVDCEFPDKHAGRSKSLKRKTHGIDFSTAYQSPLFDDTLALVACSVKYSTKNYPSEIGNTYRNYVEDLSIAAKCLALSNKASELYPSTDATRRELSGVLFWLNATGESNSLAPTVAKVICTTEENISLVDNARFEFVWNSIAIAESNSNEWQFAIHQTGHNHLARHNPNFEKILPHQILCAGPIVLRIFLKDDSKMVITTPEPFSSTALETMIDLAVSHSGTGWANHVEICFPNYHELNDGDVASATISRTATKALNMKIKVSSIDPRSPISR